MPNQLSLNGGQPQKQTRFTPLYTGRFFQGLYSNRSPLRMGGLNWITEKFYGGQNDALIDGSNVEISNRLTLQRRPGNPSFTSSATFDDVDHFDEFRLFGPNTEQIDVMIDQSAALYTGLVEKDLVFTKSAGAGQTFVQSVGNSLYFGNGIDQKKWLQSLVVWSSGASWNGPTTPFFTTYLTDTNGNIQQLIATALTVTHVKVVGTTLTITCTAGQIASSGLAVGQQIFFDNIGTETALNGAFVTVLTIVGNTFTAATTLSATDAADSGQAIIVNGGTPVSGSSTPSWATVALTPSTSWPYPANVLTVDGTALWINRSLETVSQESGIFNWGIAAPTSAPVPNLGGTIGAWVTDTFFSFDGVIIDSNGNLQHVSTPGKSGSTAPTWATLVGNTTTDGTVVWTLIQLAASLVWGAHTQYAPGHYIVAAAGGQNCLFVSQPLEIAEIIQQPVSAQPNTTTGDYVNLYYYDGDGNSGIFKPTPATAGAASAHAKVNSLLFNVPNDPNSQPMVNFTLNQSGEETGTTTPYAGATSGYSMIALFSVNIPQSLIDSSGGNVSIAINHDDGMFFGIDGGAALVSGPNLTFNSNTAMNSYPVIGGNNSNASTGGFIDNYVVSFPAAGQYNFEIDYFQWKNEQTLSVKIQGFTPIPIANGTNLASMTNPPVWPAWSISSAPGYPTVTEQSSFTSSFGTYSPTGGAMIWSNHGPAVDFTWHASTNFTLGNSTIVDSNGNQEAPYRTGVTGTKAPVWNTGLNQLTNDNPNLIWINQGPAAAAPAGTLSTFNGGWQYVIALVNTLDDTVSNASPLSASTGNFVGVTAVTFAPGSGLPVASKIDPQADYVAIFRTTDGESTPFLITGIGNTVDGVPYTLPLSEYLATGYSDTTPDTLLNNLISAPIAGEQTPPPSGAVNLTFHLDRIFFSVGNTVYWTSGPDVPVGNGVNGVAPENFDEFPSLVHKLVPTAIGLFVFTVSDTYIIPGQGTANNPILSGQPFLQGIGISSYNAVGVNGSIIGLFTTDNQFLILDPSAGTVFAGHAIGDKFRQNNGSPGTTWNPANVYVTWHVNGEDQAWYVSDGQFGWYRMCPTPAPESPGITWSPFAAIVGGCKAVQSVEVAPGVHKLLVGPTGSGVILNRDLNTFTDNTNTYPAFATLGSIVLANTGQVAEVSFYTTDSVKVGTPLTLGILLDEAVPYFTGPFEMLKTWETDPVSKPKSNSILGQRFYLSDNPDVTAICRHTQIKIQWIQEAFMNELLAIAIYGAYFQES